MTIVTDTLIAEYRRMRNKLNGSAARLAYANSQVVLETGLLAEYQYDLDLLADTIVGNGGALPPDEPAQ